MGRFIDEQRQKALGSIIGKKIKAILLRSDSIQLFFTDDTAIEFFAWSDLINNSKELSKVNPKDIIIDQQSEKLIINDICN